MNLTECYKQEIRFKDLPIGVKLLVVGLSKLGVSSNTEYPQYGRLIGSTVILDRVSNYNGTGSGCPICECGLKNYTMASGEEYYPSCYNQFKTLDGRKVIT